MTSGLQKGDLVIVAARPGDGQDLVLPQRRPARGACGWARRSGSSRSRCRRSSSRCACSAPTPASTPTASARASSTRRTGRGSPRPTPTSSQSRIFIDDSATISPLEMRAKCRRLKAEHGLGLIIVDYLQLVTGVGPRREPPAGALRDQPLDEGPRQGAGVPGDRALAALARPGGAHRPAPAALGPSRVGALEQDADIVDVHLPAKRSTSRTDENRGSPQMHAIGEDQRIVAARSDKVWKVGYINGSHDVRLASGRSIRTTGRRSPSRCERLGAGRATCARRPARALPPHPRTRKSGRWPDDRLVLLGHLVGDGSYLVHAAPCATPSASAENSRARCAEAARREFGATVNRHEGRGAWHQLVISGNGDRWHPAGLGLWLKELGDLRPAVAREASSRGVFALSNDQLALLLRHLWATDGTISVRKRGTPSEAPPSTSRRAAVAWPRTSPRLLDALRHRRRGCTPCCRRTRARATSWP